MSDFEQICLAVPMRCGDCAYDRRTWLKMCEKMARIHKWPISLRETDQFYSGIDNARFRDFGVAARVVVETQTVGSACGFAAEDFGLAIVPEWLAMGLGRTDVDRVPLDIGIKHSFEVIFPSRSRRREIAVDFAAACRSA